MLGYSTLLLLAIFGSIECMKLAANSPQAIAINQATLGNDTVSTQGGVGLAISEPYFPGFSLPEDIQAACGKYENPEQQFSRITEQRNDSIDFAQFLQLDACATAWRKHDFMKIDTNNDSKISADEWNAHNEKLRKELEDAILSQKNFTFNRLDSDKDGKLSKKELKKYLNERMIDSSNLTVYLNGSQLNFKQFADFDSTIPNATFPMISLSPIYDYSVPVYTYGYDLDGDVNIDVVDPIPLKPQPRPAILPQIRPAVMPQFGPAVMPAIDVMPLPANISLPSKTAADNNKMSIQIEPPVVVGSAAAQINPAVIGPNVPSAQVLPKIGEPVKMIKPIGGPATNIEGSMSAAVMPH